MIMFIEMTHNCSLLPAAAVIFVDNDINVFLEVNICRLNQELCSVKFIAKYTYNTKKTNCPAVSTNKFTNMANSIEV